MKHVKIRKLKKDFMRAVMKDPNKDLYLSVLKKNYHVPKQKQKKKMENESIILSIKPKYVKKILSGEKKCAKCGSDKNVEKVYISSFTGQGHFEYLCATCALKEKRKCY